MPASFFPLLCSHRGPALGSLFTIVLVAGAGPLGGQVLFDSHGFESPHYAPGELHFQNDWSAFDGMVVVGGAGVGGGSAVVIPPEGNAYIASRAIGDPDFNGAASRYTLSADLLLGSGNREGTIVALGLSAEYAWELGSFGLGVGRAGLLYLNGALQVAAFTSLNDDLQPDPVGMNLGWFLSAPAFTMEFDTFYRFELLFDFGTQRFDVSVDGVRVLESVPFPYSGSYVSLVSLGFEMDDLLSNDLVLEGAGAVDNLVFAVAAPVPEPAAFGALLGAAALGFAGLRRRRRSAGPRV